MALATIGLWVTRESLDKAHAALIYLLVVLGGSSRQGRGVGISLAVVCFLCFDFFLLPPYNTLVIRDPLDWLVLIVFLITGIVAAQQLYRAQREADMARHRAAEIDHLAALGAETLNAGRAEDAVQAIAEVIQRTLKVDSCEIHMRMAEGEFRRIACAVLPGLAPTPADGLFEYLIEHDGIAMERTGGSTHVTTREDGSLGAVLRAHPDSLVVAYPLKARERGVGVLRIAQARALAMTEPQHRFLEALAYYAALGVERVQLTADAEHARALREADRLKDALLASVSHDLRTPLTTIKALAHDMGMGGDIRARVVEEEVDRLNRFVSDLLDLSQIESEGIRVAPELNAADDLLGSALQRCAGVSGNHEIRAGVPVDELLVGQFDFSLSLRALVNLIENACKYSPPSTLVEITAGREDAYLVFRVADRGAGVPASERERIFEPFFRAGRPADVGGTGLGLAIARRFAEAQGGAVRYEARAGGGSTFTLLLPIAASDPAPPARTSGA